MRILLVGMLNLAAICWIFAGVIVLLMPYATTSRTAMSLAFIVGGVGFIGASIHAWKMMA
jgi:hypothetical protein